MTENKIYLQLSSRPSVELSPLFIFNPLLSNTIATVPSIQIRAILYLFNDDLDNAIRTASMGRSDDRLLLYTIAIALRRRLDIDSLKVFKQLSMMQFPLLERVYTHVSYQKVIEKVIDLEAMDNPRARKIVEDIQLNELKLLYEYAQVQSKQE
ncbi:hypothetical protein E3P77_03813 [Wallemia ichthyophaga]|nr:hypothetical protein E3P77_03813 [Wallemia ichthyophaga]